MKTIEQLAIDFAMIKNAHGLTKDTAHELYLIEEEMIRRCGVENARNHMKHARNILKMMGANR